MGGPIGGLIGGLMGGLIVGTCGGGGVCATFDSSLTLLFCYFSMKVGYLGFCIGLLLGGIPLGLLIMLGGLPLPGGGGGGPIG